jgi:hypothetical protein
MKGLSSLMEPESGSQSQQIVLNDEDVSIQFGEYIFA